MVRFVRVAATTVFILAFTVAGCEEDSPDWKFVVKTLGLTLVRPPSTFFSPGSIVAVTSVSPFQADLVCDADTSLGTNFKVKTSPSVNEKLAEHTKGSFSLFASYHDLLTGDASFSAISDIKGSLANVKLLEIPDDAVFDNIQHRTPGCRSAIGKRIANKEVVTMIKGVASADIVYTIEFNSDAKLSVEAKKDLIKNLSAKMEIAGTMTSSDSVSGSGLYWGVKASPYLVNPVLIAQGDGTSKFDLGPINVSASGQPSAADLRIPEPQTGLPIVRIVKTASSVVAQQAPVYP